MKYFSPFTSLTLLTTLSTNHAFQPSLMTRKKPMVKSITKSSSSMPMDMDYKDMDMNMDVDFFNPTRKLDMDHVHDCAEHFGKCPIEELEAMRGALHIERLQHEATSYRNDPAKELDHRLLEEDLEFQLALLKDEMHTLPSPQLSPHFMTNGKTTFYPPHLAIQSNAGTTGAMDEHQRHHQKSDTNLQSFVRQGEEMFLIPNGFSDIVAFGVALLILSIAPFILHG